MTGIDIKSFDCSRRSQLDDRPEAIELDFIWGGLVLKRLPIIVRIVSTGFPAIVESAVRTELPFQTLCGLGHGMNVP